MQIYAVSGLRCCNTVEDSLKNVDLCNRNSIFYPPDSMAQVEKCEVGFE